MFIDGWYGEFNRGRSSFQDEIREDCPKSGFVQETIDAVRQLILQNHHGTYREIETILGISGTSIHSILHQHFTVKKICSRWIPHNLSIAQKIQSIRVAKVLQQLVQTMQKCIYLNWEYFKIQQSDFR